MAYEKTNWSNGSTPLSAENLQHIEDGIEALEADVEVGLAAKVDKVTGKGLSTNDYTTAEKTKLAGIASDAEANVQSDWNQTTTTADSYIKNKPGNASTSSAGLMSASDKAKLNSQPTFVAGSYVHGSASAPEITDYFEFTDSNLAGKSTIVMSTQSTGNPVLRCSTPDANGKVKVYFSDAIRTMKVSYIAW